jgi:hypothetical protein
MQSKTEASSNKSLSSDSHSFILGDDALDDQLLEKMIKYLKDGVFDESIKDRMQDKNFIKQLHEKYPEDCKKIIFLLQEQEKLKTEPQEQKPIKPQGSMWPNFSQCCSEISKASPSKA